MKTLQRVFIAVLCAIGLSVPVMPANAGVVPINYGDNAYNLSLCNAETDSFSFEGNVGDRVVAFVTIYYDYGGNCSRGWCGFDLAAEIKDSDGVMVDHQTSAVNNNWCDITLRLRLDDVRLTKTGQYILTIHDSNYYGGGVFSLYLQRVSEPAQVNEMLVTGNQFIKSIASVGTVHTYTFNAIAGDSVTVGMTKYANSGGNLIPQLELYSPDGRILDRLGTGFLTKRYLAVAGKYTLLALSSTKETGTYVIAFNSNPTPTVPVTWGSIKTMYH